MQLKLGLAQLREHIVTLGLDLAAGVLGASSLVRSEVELVAQQLQLEVRLGESRRRRVLLPRGGEGRKLRLLGLLLTRACVLREGAELLPERLDMLRLCREPPLSITR
jgi:hypothetical protein